MKMHFDWALYIIGAVYGVITALFVGWEIFIASLVIVVIVYFVLMIKSIGDPSEPREQ